VEAIRNTPFIVQLFFVFFGLPALGIRIDEYVAARVRHDTQSRAYSVEIIRSGIAAVRRGILKQRHRLP